VADVSRASEVRSFMRDAFPIMPGRHPNRPAPMHILNSFLYCLLGPGVARGNVHGVVFGRDLVALDKLLGGAARPEDRMKLSRAAGALLNSDHRAFPAPSGPSSFFPLHAAFVGNDPSDDQYGRGLIALLTVEQRVALRTQFQRLLDVEERKSDVFSRVTGSLAKALSSGTPIDESDLLLHKIPEPQSKVLGSHFFALILNRLERLETDSDGADVVQLMFRLANFLTAFVALALVFEGARGLGNGDDEEIGLGSVLALPVYCGKPPGSVHDMSVEFSARCLAEAASRSHSGIRQQFCERVPADEGELESVVLNLVSGERGTEVIRAFREHDVVKSPGDAFDRMLPVSVMQRAFKFLGTKTGMVAPSRGYGKSRLVLETTFLDSLTFFVGEDNMRFEDFVEQCYLRLGLLIGRPSALSEEVESRLERIAGKSIDVEPILDSMAEAARRRLISCGLAQEFSDHATVLRLT